jgi:hypothetical protein
VKDTRLKVILADYSHRYKDMDRWDADPVPREYEFTIRSNAPEIAEQNSLSFIDFPVSVIYSNPMADNIYLATRLGMKACWPLSKNYILKESDLYTRLYFEEWDLELFDIPAHGFT